jgi:hypothetical protein
MISRPDPIILTADESIKYLIRPSILSDNFSINKKPPHNNEAARMLYRFLKLFILVFYQLHWLLQRL